jgi:alkaline phosphatase D
MKRRRFLQLTAASLAAAPFLEGCDPAVVPPEEIDPAPPVDADAFDRGARVRFDASAIPLDEALFACGVQGGSMTSSAAGARLMLWTAIDAAAPDLRLRVWRELPAAERGAPDEVVLVADLPVAADAEGFVKVPLEGLAPSTSYHYAFFVGDAEVGSAAFLARSALGRVRTAWAADWLLPVTLGATTCTNPRNAPFKALERLAEEEIDALVHLGDLVYADGSVTREDYRAHYRRALTDPGYRALLGRQGGYFVWDDHEFDNNLDPETIDPAKLENGAAEFYANLPMTPNPEGRLWQSFVWGKTLEVFALDARTERRPSTRSTAQPIYIGVEQMAWLKRSLKESRSHFKVILNSVPMTRMPEMWASRGDRWQGYDVQRTELIGFIEAEGIENVWFLSGDFHVGFVARVEPAGYGRNVFEAAVGPGGNFGNPLAILATQDGYREDVFPAAQFFYGSGRMAATTLRFDPLTDSVRVRYVGTDGEVLFDEAIEKG